MRALDSCGSQSYQNIEVIVVDDGSDNVDFLKDIESTCSFSIKIFSLGENKGGSYARNYGAEKSLGQYLVFLDSDDILKPEAVSRHIACHESLCFPDSLVSYGQAQRVRIDRSGKRAKGKVLPSRSIGKGESVALYLFSLEGRIFTPSFMISRNKFFEVRFNEALRRHQDYGFFIDAQRKGVEFLFIDAVVFEWVSDFADEGASAKGVNLNAAKVFLSEYSLHFSEQERLLYMKNIAASIAISSRDFVGFFKIQKKYFGIVKALFYTPGSLFTSMTRMIHRKLEN